MRGSRWVMCVMLVALAGAMPGASAAGGPPPNPTRQSSSTLTGTAAPGLHQLQPDILVKSVWIGGGALSQAFTPLEFAPRVGETISLGCEIVISGSVPSKAFKVVWYIDGAKTCGEGAFTVQNPPICEFAWPFTVGAKAYISYVVRQAGAHTYRCAADVGNQVAERKEDNNSGQASFTVVDGLPTVVPPLAMRPPGAGTGPKIQGY